MNKCYPRGYKSHAGIICLLKGALLFLHIPQLTPIYLVADTIISSRDP